jgi:hypothetical protein
MGCCESSGHKHYKFNTRGCPSEPHIYAIGVMNTCPLSEKFKSAIKLSSESVNLEVLHDTSPTDMNQIDLIAFRLLFLPGWEVKENCASLRIECRKGSVYNSKLSVMLGYIDFGLNIPVEKILNMLFYPEMRQSWDTSIQNMNVVNRFHDSHFILKYEMQYLNRAVDFEVEVSVESEMEETLVTYHSVAHKDLADPYESLRGDIVFGCIRILEREDSTLIMIMTQDNLESFNRRNNGVSCRLFYEWVELFRGEMLKYHTVIREKEIGGII